MYVCAKKSELAEGFYGFKNFLAKYRTIKILPSSHVCRKLSLIGEEGKNIVHLSALATPPTQNTTNPFFVFYLFFIPVNAKCVRLFGAGREEICRLVMPVAVILIDVAATGKHVPMHCAQHWWPPPQRPTTGKKKQTTSS